MDNIEDVLRGEFDLDIPNFKKWNPDTRSRRAWFALSVDWFRDPRVAQLTLTQRAVWVHLLSIRASHEGHLRGTRASLVAQSMGTRPSDVVHSLLKFAKLGLINLRCVALQDRQDKTDRTRQTDMSEPAPSGAPSPPNLVSLWNENRGSLPAIAEMNKSRTKHWKSRWLEKPDEGYWRGIIHRISQSAFCSGSNDRGWRASVDFLLRPNTHIKAMEGQYDNNPQARKKTYAEQNEAALADMYQRVKAGEL